MPLSHIILPAPGIKIGFWHIAENSEELMQMYAPDEQEQAEMAIMKEQRRQHYLTSRLLIKNMHPEEKIYKDAFGKPHLASSKSYISWTHSGNYAAAISNLHEPTGIDLEGTGPRILRIEDKFCNEKDKSIIHKTHHIESLVMIWAAKEALYKVYGKKEVDFKLHMTCGPFDLHESGRFQAFFHKNKSHATFQMEYMRFQGYITVWALGVHA